MSSERTGRCRSSGGGGGPHGKTAFGNVPFRADGFFRFRCWCPVFSGTSDSGRMPARMFPTRVVRKLRVPERCRSMPPHLFGVGARMRGREVGREPALSGPVRAGPGKGPAACAADLLSAVAGKDRPSFGRFVRRRGTLFCGINGRSGRLSRGVPVAERLYFAPFPGSFRSDGCRSKGGENGRRATCRSRSPFGLCARRSPGERFPDRENLPALSSARSVRDRRGIN